MPANRSRTLEWRRCLRQVFERGGSIEIAVAPDAASSDASQHLVWRVRLLGLSETEIVVEQPSALGQAININAGTSLLVVLSIGQNRWMFTTKNLGTVQQVGQDRKFTPALRLVMPESVQRCQRRTHYRVETATLSLPMVEMWPLLDPKSVLVAERAYEIQYEVDLVRQNEAPGTVATALGVSGSAGGVFDHESVMPEVGPKFTGTLLNLGGGGVGLRVGPEDSQVLARHKLLWLRIFLPPTLNTPICATGKVVHTHMESNHDIYTGLAFDFSFNPSHQRFVIDQICRYIALQQRMQLQQYLPPDRRKTA